MKLLLVHANDLIIDKYKDRLEKEGYEVICAKSGAEGRDKVVTEYPKIIVTDFDLPDMTGREFLKGMIYSGDNEEVMRIIKIGIGNFNHDNSFHTDGYLDYQQTPDRLVEKIQELKKIKIKYYTEMEEFFG